MPTKEEMLEIMKKAQAQSKSEPKAQVPSPSVVIPVEELILGEIQKTNTLLTELRRILLGEGL